jgi:orotidine-5'-phosphate decarboxylase
VLAVSVLTSLDAAALAEAWGRPATLTVDAEVVRLARLAQSSGIDGLVCSALEAAAVRTALGGGLELLIPGIRLSGTGSDDQVRVATPAAAAASGATYIVLGRAVTESPNLVAAMNAALGQLESASAEVDSVRPAR